MGPPIYEYMKCVLCVSVCVVASRVRRRRLAMESQFVSRHDYDAGCCWFWSKNGRPSHIKWKTANGGDDEAAAIIYGLTHRKVYDNMKTEHDKFR